MAVISHTWIPLTLVTRLGGSKTEKQHARLLWIGIEMDTLIWCKPICLEGILRKKLLRTQRGQPHKFLKCFAMGPAALSVWHGWRRTRIAGCACISMCAWASKKSQGRQILSTIYTCSWVLIRHALPLWTLTKTVSWTWSSEPGMVTRHYSAILCFSFGSCCCSLQCLVDSYVQCFKAFVRKDKPRKENWSTLSSRMVPFSTFRRRLFHTCPLRLPLLRLVSCLAS